MVGAGVAPASRRGTVLVTRGRRIAKIILIGAKELDGVEIPLGIGGEIAFGLNGKGDILEDVLSNTFDVRGEQVVRKPLVWRLDSVDAGCTKGLGIRDSIHDSGCGRTVTAGIRGPM